MSAIIFKVLDALLLLRKTIQNWRMEPSCPWDLQLWMKNWEKSQISFIMNILSTIRSKFGFAIWLRWNSNLPRHHINIKNLPKHILRHTGAVIEVGCRLICLQAESRGKDNRWPQSLPCASFFIDLYIIPYQLFSYLLFLLPFLIVSGIIIVLSLWWWLYLRVCVCTRLVVE